MLKFAFELSSLNKFLGFMSLFFNISFWQRKYPIITKPLIKKKTGTVELFLCLRIFQVHAFEQLYTLLVTILNKYSYLK